MSTYLPARSLHRVLVLWLVAALQPANAVQEDEEAGWTPEHMPPASPWREQSFELPPYPEADRLIEISVQTGNFPFHVFVDPESLTIAGDGVVRLATVIRSTAGAENVSFEGIHCKTREFRRYAYGARDSWQVLEGTGWQQIKSGGMGHYRFVLYRDYVCDPEIYGLKVNEMIQRMRYSRGTVLDE